MTWQRSGPHIVAQKTDNEVIVADLQSGLYYDIGGSGPVMWDAIEQGHSRQQIIQLLEEAYESTPEFLGQELTAFVDQLVADDLIKSATAATVTLPHARQISEKQAYTPAAIVKYVSTDEAFATKAKLVDWQRSAPYVVGEITGDEVIIVHAQKGISCRATECGTLIWQGIECGYSRDEIVASVLSQYDTSAEIAGLEVDEFIAKLAGLNLIQPKGVAAVMHHTSKSAPVHGSVKKTFSPPTMTVDNDKREALKRITELNGWQVSAPHIVSETIEDEVIAVDLQQGVYHSITGAGTLIWEDIMQAHSSEHMLDTLLSHYEITAETASAELDEFISKLTEFDLIRPRQTKPERTSTAKAAPTTKQPFAPPVMVIYRDMETVLRLDPVHDFDEFGWPGKV